MSSILNIIQKNELRKILSNRVSKNTIKVFFIHSFGIGLAIILNFWLARLLDVSGYGRYSFAITLINLLSSFACLGFSSTLVRDIASFNSRNFFGEIKGLYRLAYLVGIGSSLFLILILSVAYWFNLLPFSLDVFVFINISVSVLTATLLLLRQFTLQGLNFSVESQVVNGVIRYVFILSIVFLFCSLFSFSLDQAIFANTIGLFLSLIVIEIVFRRKLPVEITSTKAVFDAKPWIKSALFLLIFKIISNYLIHSEVILLGFMREDSDVGIYSLARKIAGFVSFGLLAANIVLSPKIASLYYLGEKESLERLIQKSMRWVFLFSLLVSLLLSLAAFPILDFLGKNYTYSYLPLLIMMGGELVNVAFGPVALLLINSNQEREANKNILITLIFNILSNIILIHFYGYLGASIATAMSTIFWNVLMAIDVKRKLNIKSWIW